MKLKSLAILGILPLMFACGPNEAEVKDTEANAQEMTDEFLKETTEEVEAVVVEEVKDSTAVVDTTAN